MAASTSSLAARRAGQVAASKPSRAARKQLVDAGGLGLLELGPGLHLRVGVQGQGPDDGSGDGAPAGGPQQQCPGRLGAEMPEEEPGAGQVAADDGVGLVDAADAHSALIASSALLVADLDTEAPNTDIAATRARPTMSAEAVCAVRRGLRIEFCRPSWPGTPSSRASGRPSTLDNGRAIAGASMAAPTKMPTAPPPTSGRAGLTSPRASRTPPARATAVPEANRRRSGTSTLA